jgi:hypothetical protein
VEHRIPATHDGRRHRYRRHLTERLGDFIRFTKSGPIAGKNSD